MPSRETPQVGRTIEPVVIQTNIGSQYVPNEAEPSVDDVPHVPHEGQVLEIGRPGAFSYTTPYTIHSLYNTIHTHSVDYATILNNTGASNYMSLNEMVTMNRGQDYDAITFHALSL